MDEVFKRARTHQNQFIMNVLAKGEKMGLRQTTAESHNLKGFEKLQ
jgi:hypothetical protein